MAEVERVIRICPHGIQVCSCDAEKVDYVPKQELTQAEDRGRVLTEALVEAVIPLEVLAGERRTDHPFYRRLISEDLWAQIDRSIQAVRKALDSSTGSR